MASSSLALFQETLLLFNFMYGVLSTFFCRLGTMGFLKSTFSLLIGTGCGIYIAQNYNVPNMKKLARALLGQAKELEESYKKPTDGKNKG